MMKRKGQGAMEYLMTYGWAILVVMIVGVVLWQLGIFGPSGTVNGARGFSKIKVFDNSIRYAPNDATNSLTFTIMNGAGQTIKDVVISPGNGCSLSATTTPAAGQTTNNLTIGAGDTYAYALDCPEKAPSESFSVALNLSYIETVVGTPVPRTEAGVIRGTTEKA